MKSASMVKLQEGFTLIEIIVVLVLLGILGAMAGLGISTGVRGYLIAAENAAMSQKAQMAMSRLGREITECFNCDSDNSSFASGSNTWIFENTLGARKVENDSGTLKLNDNILVDGVDDFDMVPDEPDNPDLIIITLRLSHQTSGSVQEFKTTILPRNR